eukprot:7867380-Pyramimonas_sp.AAC.1
MPSVGLLGALLGASERVFGRAGGLSSRLGRCEDEETRYSEYGRFPSGMGRFGPLGALLEALLSHLGGLLAMGASEAVLGLPGVL